MTTATSAPSFADLLRSAVTEPGILSDAYRQFHNYSIGNQLLAWSQCLQRGIPPGPMATFPRWKELGRYVRKGEKAITLCQPVTVKRPAERLQRVAALSVQVAAERLAVSRSTVKRWRRQIRGLSGDTDGLVVPTSSGE